MFYEKNVIKFNHFLYMIRCPNSRKICLKKKKKRRRRRRRGRRKLGNAIVKLRNISDGKSKGPKFSNLNLQNIISGGCN